MKMGCVIESWNGENKVVLKKFDMKNVWCIEIGVCIGACRGVLCRCAVYKCTGRLSQNVPNWRHQYYTFIQ